MCRSTSAGEQTEVCSIGTAPWPTVPPRRCVNLQRMTVRGSHSFGFMAPPASLPPCGTDLDVFPRTASSSVSLTSWIPLMVLRSPSRSSAASPVATPQQLTRAVVSSFPSSREVWCPFGAPSSENLLPGSTFSPPLPLGLTPGLLIWLPSLASSRGPTLASFRLRRFSRPWRVTPLRTRWSVPSTHAHGVGSLLSRLVDCRSP
jgi:hypothetical protein